jgi:tRNA (guanine-N7-)-methyltransferase
MPRKKLIRFDEIKNFPNVCEDWEVFQQKSLPPHKKLILELGCGKGDYTINLAQRHPENFYIGFERKGERIWRAAKTAQEKDLKNTLFIRSDIAHINDFFPHQSVEEIWITFPGPFPKDRHENRRLTSPYFIERYAKLLKKDHIIHLKTDHKGLFDYTQDLIQSNSNLTLETSKKDIHNTTHNIPNLDILTDFENKH